MPAEPQTGLEGQVPISLKTVGTFQTIRCFQIVPEAHRPASSPSRVQSPPGAADTLPTPHPICFQLRSFAPWPPFHKPLQTPSCVSQAAGAPAPLGTQRLAQRLAHSKLLVSVGGRAWASVGERVSAGACCPPGGKTVTGRLSVSARVAQWDELEAKENVTQGTRATEEAGRHPGAGGGRADGRSTAHA